MSSGPRTDSPPPPSSSRQQHRHLSFVLDAGRSDPGTPPSSHPSLTPLRFPFLPRHRRDAPGLPAPPLLATVPSSVSRSRSFSPPLRLYHDFARNPRRRWSTPWTHRSRANRARARPSRSLSVEVAGRNQTPARFRTHPRHTNAPSAAGMVVGVWFSPPCPAARSLSLFRQFRQKQLTLN